MNVLFVCSANIDRSRTAEAVFTARYPAHKFRSAGTNHDVCKDCSTTLVTNDHVKWADQIFAMEEKHLEYINSLQPENIADKVTVLEVPDRYKYLNAGLIAILEEKVHF
jgi:predicted protein tyrosine phosphatase